MKKIKLSFGPFDRFEEYLFGVKFPMAPPVSGQILKVCLPVWVITTVLSHILDERVGKIVLPVLSLSVIIYCGYKASTVITSFSSSGKRIGFMVYCIMLGFLSFFAIGLIVLAVQLIVWALLGVMVLSVVWFLLKYVVPHLINHRG